MRLLFKHLEAKYPHHRRLPIYGIAFCFLLSFASERAFGIADITGAYVAGLILAGRTSTSYLERRTDIASYIIFTPVFFAKIGITTEWKPIDPQFLGFGIAFIAAGILGKLLGCGVGAKVTGLSLKDSYRAGVGMMCRAEVCLICAQKGIDAGLINPNIQIFIIILIILTSFAVPLLLKLSYKNDKSNSDDNGTKSQIIEDGETFVKNVNEAEVEIPRVGTNLGDL
jgi:Kef-type K+ transport system membrane component KefB